MGKKILILSLIIIYLFLNLFIYITYAVTQVIDENTDGINEEKYPGIKALIQQLQQEHPTWKFKILYTKLDWNEVINNESLHQRNLVPSDYTAVDEFVCNECGNTLYEGGNWKCASNKTIGYMMDVRYFLNEYNVFQFLDIQYDNSCTRANVQKMVSGTFLNKDSYIDALMNSGKKYNLNPYYLVARIIQEQGTSGTKPLSSGNEYTTNSGNTYSGLYNLYNISATGDDIIDNGFKKAEQEGWTSIELAIAGGAKWIKENYVNVGQTNLYLQKFDVENNSKGLYWHQYMQNVMAAQSEGTKLRNILSQSNALNNEYTFLIPVYENMPRIDNIDLVKLNVSSSLQLRQGPYADSKRVGYGYKDSIFVRIKKATSKVDGYYWDLIIQSNGMIGYMARDASDGSKTYLQVYKELKMNVEEENSYSYEITQEDENDIIRNSKSTARLVQKTNLITVLPNVTSQDLTELIDKINSIKDKNNNIVENENKLCTGYKINDKYNIVVLGDVNGDGEVDGIDLLKIRRFLLGKDKIEGNDLYAANAFYDGEIDARDLLKVRRYLLGKDTLNI